MKTAICTQYGGPEMLQIINQKKPVPQKNEVLIKIIASSVTTADTMMRKGTPKFARLFLGFRKPKAAAMGTGFSGIIESIGSEVKSFNINDKVFGETGLSFGANSEYISIPENGLLIKKPTGISFEEAAPLCDGAVTSMNFLSQLINIKPGQHILINGASGSLGTAAIQIAKHFNATVTAVCSSVNTELVKSLGADFTIDYKKHDFTTNKNKYDVIYDTIGKSSYCECKSALKKRGVYLSPVLSLKLLLQILIPSKFSSKKAKFSATGMLPVKEQKPMLQNILHLMQKEKLATIIDRTYALENIKQAHQYVDTGRKKGNVVIVND
ncbi:NAD(P)-dependent alcohol dehydrogenase [Labilibacter sediminis]|nr:NAD(P)-dependent alcohol dehydrogenase [Labilibacter sediminis]